MAGNVPYDLNGDGKNGAYEMAFYEQDQAKASNWQAHFIDGLNSQLQDACENAEQLFSTFSEITGSSDKDVPSKLIYHELIKGIVEGHLWNQTITEPSYVFLDQQDFYPARILLKNFHRYFPAPCDFTTIENCLLSGSVLFREEAFLSPDYCGTAWGFILNASPDYLDTNHHGKLKEFISLLVSIRYTFSCDGLSEQAVEYEDTLWNNLFHHWKTILRQKAKDLNITKQSETHRIFTEFPILFDYFDEDDLESVDNISLEDIVETALENDISLAIRIWRWLLDENNERLQNPTLAEKYIQLPHMFTSSIRMEAEMQNQLFAQLSTDAHFARQVFQSTYVGDVHYVILKTLDELGELELADSFRDLLRSSSFPQTKWSVSPHSLDL